MFQHIHTFIDISTQNNSDISKYTVSWFYVPQKNDSYAGFELHDGNKRNIFIDSIWKPFFYWHKNNPTELQK